MANDDSRNLSLGEVAKRFLTKLSPKEREISQQEVHRFVRWYGWERPLAGLTAPEIANYAERLSLSDTDYAKKLELIRAFLTYAKKEGLSKTNLATHLKTKKAKAALPASAKQGIPETIPLTRQGYAEMETELDILKSKRQEVIDDIRRAAADKDFRENAPLDAAREQRSHLEGRIRELEQTLKFATIIDGKQEPALKAAIGNKVVLRDSASGEELRYVIVHPTEVDPSQGKISSVSPIGRAVIGRSEGEAVEITAPAGKLRYQIERIER